MNIGGFKMTNKFYDEKVNTTPEENAYMLYMIISSYFHKCYCHSKIMEKKLFLYYREMNQKYQVNIEEQMIENVEMELYSAVEILAKMNCDVQISHMNGGYQIIFYTGFESIKACIGCDGKYTIQMLPYFQPDSIAS